MLSIAKIKTDTTNRMDDSALEGAVRTISIRGCVQRAAPSD